MPMYTANILTDWICDEPGNRPRFMDEYPQFIWVDRTGQPAGNLAPDPNLLEIEATIDAPTLAALEADSNYLVLSYDEADS